MKKLNNKGFSLVELIIVIAIMAILIGVVGTQVIPYLENSRKAKDNQVFSSWNTAGMSAYTTCAGSLDGATNYFIKVVQSGDNILLTSGDYSDEDTLADDADNKLKDVFSSLTGLVNNASATNITKSMASKDGKTIKQFIVYIPADAPIFSVIGDGTKFDTIENK